MALSESSSQLNSQRPITFALLRNQQLAGSMTLHIRPEELSRDDPSRATVQQTLGGAWVDSFGAGLATITMSGHTGWRGTTKGDGLALFQALRKLIYEDWHAAREEAIAAGIDPDTVELLLTDSLNDYAVVVVPQQFRLQRSRSRPLLAQYRVQLPVIRQAIEPIAPGPGEVLAVDFREGRDVPDVAVEALSDTAIRLRQLAESIRDTFAPVMLTLADLADMTANVLEKTHSAVTTATTAYSAVTAPLIAVSTVISKVAANITQALVEPLALSALHRQTVMELSSTFVNAYCNLTNGFSAIERYFDFDALYGASGCSSTTGGRPQTPYFDRNPFLDLYDGTPREPVFTEEAGEAVRTVFAGDPLTLRTYPVDEIWLMTRTIIDGINVPGTPVTL